jgi:hypothetical protein
MSDNENGGRCICSDRKSELDKILLEIEKLDAQSLKMATEQVERIEMGASAEWVMEQQRLAEAATKAEEAKTNATRRRRLSAIIAACLVLAIILSGTFAWNYYRDHKTNDADVGNLKYKARLVETYDPNKTKDWKVTDADVPKIIRVYNPGAETEFDFNIYGDIFTRIQLKEFMEFYPTNEIYTADRYMIDTNGRFRSFISETAANNWVAANLDSLYNNAPHTVEKLRMFSTPFKTNSYASNADSIDRYIAQYNKLPLVQADPSKALTPADLTVGGDGATLDPDKVSIDPLAGLDDADLPWYIQTKESDPNGVYGAFILLDLSTDRNNPQPLVIGASKRAASKKALMGNMTT